MNKLIIAGIIVFIICFFSFLYYVVSSSAPTASSSSPTAPSSDSTPFSSSDLWMQDRWTSGSGYTPHSSTYGSPINTNGVECDYCGCPVRCDGTPKRVDPGCPAQSMECITQDCGVTPTCRRGT